MKFPKYKRLVVLQCYPSEDGISLQVEPERRKYVTGKMQTAYQEGKKGNQKTRQQIIQIKFQSNLLAYQKQETLKGITDLAGTSIEQSTQKKYGHSRQSKLFLFISLYHRRCWKNVYPTFLIEGQTLHQTEKSRSREQTQ